MRRLFQWKNRLLADVAFSLIEALIVLLISYLYLFVLSINYGLDTEGVTFASAFLNTVSSTLHPTEIFTYVTGVLSSTTAYFFVRLAMLRTHIKRVFAILLFTVILFWISTPLFIAGLQNAPANQTMAVGLAKVVGTGALLVWLYSLFSQRRIFERQITIAGDSRGNEIANNLRNF